MVVKARELARTEMEVARELIRDRGSLPPTRRFEWTVIVLCTWLMAGAYLDSWAHRHLARLETFFTPWHAVLYSGIFSAPIFLRLCALRRPLRAAWQRPGSGAPWTAVISASLLLSMFTFFDQFDQPLVNTWAAAQAPTLTTTRYIQELGILGIMVQTALLTGVVLYLLSRFTLPFGSITLLVRLTCVLLGSLVQHVALIQGAVMS